MRRQIPSKSHTCTEGMDVYAAGISVKVCAHYPGRSVGLPCATVVERRPDGAAEVSRGHIKVHRPDRRPEREVCDRRLEFRWGTQTLEIGLGCPITLREGGDGIPKGLSLARQTSRQREITPVGRFKS